MLWVYVQQFLNSPQVQQAAQVAQTQGIRAWNGLTRLLNTPEGQELLEAGAQIAFNAQLPAARPKPPGVGAVIGHLEAGYATYGRTWGVKVFDFASEIWEGLSPGQRREWNQQFLDALIKDRVSVAVITNGYIKLGSTLKWEVEYLLEHGYTWSKTGDVLLPPIQ